MALRSSCGSFVAGLLCFAAVAGCGSSGSADAQPDATVSVTPSSPLATVVATSVPAEPYLGVLVFGWPRDCSVPVSEHVRKNGSVADLSYTLGLVGDGADLIVSFEGLRVDEVNGESVADELQGQIAAAFVMPSFRVAPDGSVTELIGMEAVVDTIVELLGDESPEMRSMLESPEMSAALEDAVAGKYWGSWVSQWAELSPIESAVTDRVEPFRVTDDLSIETTVRYVSSAATSEGEAVLRSSQILSGDDFATAMGAVPDRLGIDAASPEMSGALAAAEGSREVVVQATVDPESLRPSSALFTMAIDATIDGVSDTRSESRLWEFDWGASDCTL